MTIQEIRGLGFEWPAFDCVRENAVESNGVIDLQATHAALLRQLEVHHDRLEGNNAFYLPGNEGLLTNLEDGHADRTAELLRGIRLVEAIIAKARETDSQKRPISVGRAAVWCLGLALLCGWAAVFLIPLATRLGLSQSAARHLPIAAAFAGAALGIAVSVAPTARQMVKAVLGMFALGAVFWIIGVLIGGLMFSADATRDLADWAPVVGFIFGLLLGLLPLYAAVADVFQRKNR